MSALVAINDDDLPETFDNQQFSPFLLALNRYLDVVGVQMSIDELIAGLPVSGSAFGVEHAKRAVNRLDYAFDVRHARRIPKAELPVCVKCKDGTFLTVIAANDTGFVVLHPTLTESKTTVSIAEMKERYSGEYYIAAPTVNRLEQDYAGTKKNGHWFWSHLARQSWATVEIIVATLVANCLAIAVSLFALQVYDRVIPNASLQTLWVLAVGAFIAIAFEAILRIARGRLIDDMGRRLESEVSADLVSKLQGMKFDNKRTPPASLGSLMREFSSVREFFTATSMGSISDIPFVFIFLAVIYVIAGPIVIVVLIAMLIIILASLFTRRALSKISEEMQGANAAQSRLLNEITYGAEAIKLHRAENRFQSSWEDISLLIASKTQEQRASGAVLSFFSQAIQQSAYIVSVVVGVYMVIAGEFSIGAIIAVGLLTTRTIAPISQLSGAISRWQQVRVALEGLTNIANSEQDRSLDRQYARREVLRGDITIKDLSFRYLDDQDPVLQIPRLSIKAGETIAVLGRNGSGKSTLLKVISGLYGYESGEVRIDGLEMRQLDPVDLRRNMGVLTQDVTLFAGTLRENLTIGPKSVSESDLEDSLKFSGLWAMVERHPLGMDMQVADGGTGLSVGQRQSLGLSRIYLADPQILLLDEPTAAMDQNLEAETIVKLKTWLKGRTCILTTHRTEIISLCDRVAVFQGGQLALLGPRDEIIQKLKKA